MINLSQRYETSHRCAFQSEHSYYVSAVQNTLETATKVITGTDSGVCDTSRLSLLRRGIFFCPFYE